ncbi:hypothetical protein [Sphingomonas mollis]|uniref:Sugar transporter n=1 Tax=Sphingomonas mollis TaxID=2795726 RepID=A0ABS0XS19_9SPHN|nr:hypothetical protein [Sphingomonas sp. BT553]MBJ6122809.1 hypothetical protein [Sphingomonas sp. BT553]
MGDWGGYRGSDRRRVPRWFGSVAILLMLWGAMGIVSCIQQVRLGADAMGTSTAYDRMFYAALPMWYNPLFAMTVGTGFAGALALLLRSTVARQFFIVSLVGIVAMFGWVFLATDLIAHKGVVEATGFPALILGVGVFQLWLASRARRRGWIG